MRQKIKFEWETLDKTTCRAKVLGGWIVHATMGLPGKSISGSMVFIPDSEHGWIVTKPLKEEIAE